MRWANNKPIIVPIDFSDESFRALAEALKIAESPSQLHIIHVMEDMASHISDIPVGRSKRNVRARRTTQALHARFAEYEQIGAHVDTRWGDPGTEIAKYAAHVGAALIVMSSHGRGNIARLWLGSVAGRVVRLADCPVLILKTAKNCQSRAANSTAEAVLVGDSSRDRMVDT